MTENVHLQIAHKAKALPYQKDFEAWVTTALRNQKPNAEVTIRIVGNEESQQLNHKYRNKNKPTNVLSFPCELPPGIDLPILGDLVMCAPVVEAEATKQNKVLHAHWAHLTIHGILHLLGYDHEIDNEAEIMENLETELMEQLGYPDPYAIEKLGEKYSNE